MIHRYSIHKEGANDPMGAVMFCNMAIAAAKAASKIEKGRLIEVIYLPLGGHASVVATFQNGREVK